ncbi:hypothetical protein Tco_1404506 [Tanacetum coccineum]
MPNTRGRSRGSHPKPFTSRSTPIRRGSSSIIGHGRKIENEWSLRGRCDNSSSRNGRDIPDECNPIGRGSNNTYGNGMGRADDCNPRGRGSNNTFGNGRGRADDCSPKGRGINNTFGNGRGRADDCSLKGRGSNNTFGNAMGRADDCSPRGRGSNNTFGNGRCRADDCSPRGRDNNSIVGCSNKSVDKWCPSLDILGDERLDVHEDTEEHVEHVVGSSQNQVGFYDPVINHHAVRLFKTIFKGAYATWTKVPQDHRDRYSDIIRSVRKVAMKAIRVSDNVDIGLISSNRPIWIGGNDWQPLVNVWDTNEWRLKSKIAKENRAKSQSGKHTVGSLIMESLVKKKQKGAILKLKRRHLKNIIFCIYTPKPSDESRWQHLIQMELIPHLALPILITLSSATKNALWNFWEKGYDNITLFDDEESSDDDCDKSNLLNHHDTSPFLDPYQAAKNEEIQRYHMKCNDNNSGTENFIQNDAPHSGNNNQRNEGICRVDKFEVIKYSIGNDEEFVTVSLSKICVVERTPGSMSCIYHELFSRKDRGWEVTQTK